MVINPMTFKFNKYSKHVETEKIITSEDLSFSPQVKLHLIIYQICCKQLRFKHSSVYMILLFVGSEIIFPPRTVAPIAKPALINIKFFIIYCPSSVGTNGNILNVSAEKKNSGVIVPNI